MSAAAGPRTIEVDLGPGVRGVFTTAHGGVSTSPWASLNLGAACGDDPSSVATNRAVLADAVGAPVAFATQVHGAHVIDVRGAAHLREVATEQARDGVPVSVGEADALVTQADDVALGVLVADCVPVLLADPAARVVATAHAGRRGVEQQVVLRALDSMVARGASAARVRAAVGPAICGRCYEVPQAMHDDVVAHVPAAASRTPTGTPALDLPAAVVAQLHDAGVVDVVVVPRCTAQDESLFSYRRAGAAGDARTGRQAGVVRLV